MDDEEKRTKLELSPTQVTASALAAVIGAVAASGLGVYGTFAGAAVVSVCATIGTATIQHAFTRARSRLGRTAGHRRATAPAAPGETLPLPVVGEPGEGPAAPECAVGKRSGAGGWRRRGTTAAAVFLTAVVGITVLEVASGGSMASWFGTDRADGPSIASVWRSGGDSRPEPPAGTGSDPASPSADPTGSGGDQPDPEPSSAEPEAASSDSATPTDPDSSAGSEPAATPSPAPSDGSAGDTGQDTGDDQEPEEATGSPGPGTDTGAAPTEGADTPGTEETTGGTDGGAAPDDSTDQGAASGTDAGSGGDAEAVTGARSAAGAGS
ncbi:hypothetical protein [Allostreptomyces psammosilenae]|uniref:Uncharacterized protein n=1 Tax=Allostreptomyces psammosilenae TaxID=1892865 RepID=A0A852ZL49_9ACTN|nr:hypothetical protein [Allostreptomyces psammosilenae]NYI03133.1 hypothetical protein [Allostreptomyces psammosilenae]